MLENKILEQCVKLVGAREESLLTCKLARDNIFEAELALDDTSKFLALRG